MFRYSNVFMRGRDERALAPENLEMFIKSAYKSLI